MVNIRIKVDFERRLEAFLFRQEGDPIELLRELWKIIEDGRYSKRDEKQSGLSYREICLILRDEIGDMLATPPKPDTKFIIRLVNRAKEIGLDEPTLRQLARGLPKKRDGWKWDLEYLIRNAPTLIAAGTGNTAESGRPDETTEGGSSNVYTGR